MEAGDDVQAARLAPELERLPGLLPGIAELIVSPVTALSDDTDPCAGSGTARTIAHFVSQDLPDAPTDVIQTLQALRGEHVERARRRWTPWWLCTGSRTTVRMDAHRARSMRWAGR
ncbi:hypothetical protein [Streptomyces sp. NPDC054783]